MEEIINMENMDHRKLSEESFSGEPPPMSIPSSPLLMNSSLGSVKSTRGRRKISFESKSDLMLYFEETSSEASILVNETDLEKLQYVVDPAIVVFCVELLSKYEKQFSPDEYLMTQLSKKMKWTEYDLLILADMFFACLDKDSMLNAVVLSFKNSKLNKAFEWDYVELTSLKVLSFILLVETTRIGFYNLYDIFHTFGGVSLGLSFYQYVCNEAYENSDLIFSLMEVYSAEYVEKYLYPNLVESASVLEEVLKSFQPEKQERPKTTKFIPFSFQLRPTKEPMLKKKMTKDASMSKIQFKAQEVPKATYATPSINKILEMEYEKNRIKTNELLEIVKRSSVKKSKSEIIKLQEVIGELEDNVKEANEMEGEIEAKEASIEHEEISNVENKSPSTSVKIKDTPKNEKIAKKKMSTGKKGRKSVPRKSINKGGRNRLKKSLPFPNSLSQPLNQDELEKTNADKILMSNDNEGKELEKKSNNNEIEVRQTNDESKELLEIEVEKEVPIEFIVKPKEGYQLLDDESDEESDDEAFNIDIEEQLNTDEHVEHVELEIEENEEVEKQQDNVIIPENEIKETTKLKEEKPKKQNVGMKRLILNRVLQEPTFRGRHTFASVMRLHQIFQLRDEKERAELDQLLSYSPLKKENPEEERLMLADILAKKTARFEEIKMAIHRAKEATNKLVATKQEQAKSVRQETEYLENQRLAKKQMDYKRIKDMASEILKNEAFSPFKSTFTLHARNREKALELKENLNELLMEARRKAKDEMSIRNEKILKIKASQKMRNKPNIIKNPFEVKKTEIPNAMSEAEARLRLQVIRRQNEAQVDLLRAKIKNEKEEKAVKFKRALEEIEKRTSQKYKK